VKQPDIGARGHSEIPGRKGTLPGQPLLDGIEISFPATDGYELGGVHFQALGESAPSVAVVLAGGGGVSARRYRHFARFLSSSGIPVLTFDYRGIGRSRPPSLRGFKATIEDWSECDCGGAIAWMRARYCSSELTGITHSIGSLVLGGAKNVSELSQLVFIAPHTGYCGDYAKRVRIPMAVVWHVVMPALTHMFGYFPGRMLRLGEDIPEGMALQWAARTSPEFFPKNGNAESSRARAILARFAGVDVPTLALAFTDDAFATESGARRLLSCYPDIQARFELVEPSATDSRGIGHFGFFRRNADIELWRSVMNFLTA